jgi:hypothetical protein
MRLKDEIMGKDMAIAALSETLIEKGDENMMLSEMVSQFKNHLLSSKELNEKFAVQRVGSLKYEEVTVILIKLIHFKYSSNL